MVDAIKTIVLLHITRVLWQKLMRQQLEDLHPGLLYKIVVEAVVSVKDAVTNTKDPEVEKQNRRTTHVISKPVFVRTRAPCETSQTYCYR